MDDFIHSDVMESDLIPFVVAMYDSKGRGQRTAVLRVSRDRSLK